MPFFLAFNGSTLMYFHIKWNHLSFPACCKELGMDLGDARRMVCPECQLSKLNRKRAPAETITRADQALYRIHADLSGRKLSSLDGFRYYLLLTDDYSRYRWVRLLRQKSDAPNEIM